MDQCVQCFDNGFTFGVVIGTTSHGLVLEFAIAKGRTRARHSVGSPATAISRVIRGTPHVVPPVGKSLDKKVEAGGGDCDVGGDVGNVGELGCLDLISPGLDPLPDGETVAVRVVDDEQGVFAVGSGDNKLGVEGCRDEASVAEVRRGDAFATYAG